jgi:hypothetical protein
MVLEGKLFKKLKYGHEMFLARKDWFWDFLLGYPKSRRFKDLQGSLACEIFLITFFEFIGQYYYQNDVFIFQEVISEL